MTTPDTDTCSPEAPPRAVTLTLGQLADALSALQHLALRPMAQRIAYDIGRLSSLAEVELRQYEKQRQALVKTHGEERPTNDRERMAGHTSATITVVKDTEQETFQTELDDLRSTEITLAWRPIVLADLREPGRCPCGERRPLDMTSGHMMQLLPLVHGEPAEDRCRCEEIRRTREAEEAKAKAKAKSPTKPKPIPDPD